MPVTPGPERFPVLVGVLDTKDGFALAMATNALADAEIMFDVVPITSPGEELKAATWEVAPSRVLVAIEDGSDAVALLEPFQQADVEEIDSGAGRIRSNRDDSI